MKIKIALTCAAVAAVTLSGCSSDGTLTPVSTSSVGGSATAQVQKVDPACITLAAEIDTLRKDGIAEKIEKAAAKKYKMKPTDLAQADKLNKANADYQTKCSAPNIPRQAAVVPAVAPSAAAVAPNPTSASTSSGSAAKPSSTATSSNKSEQAPAPKKVSAKPEPVKAAANASPAPASAQAPKPKRVVSADADSAPAASSSSSANESPQFPGMSTSDGSVVVTTGR